MVADSVVQQRVATSVETVLSALCLLIVNTMGRLHEKKTYMRTRAITVDTVVTTVTVIYKAYESIIDAESPISSVLWYRYYLAAMIFSNQDPT